MALAERLPRQQESGWTYKAGSIRPAATWMLSVTDKYEGITFVLGYTVHTTCLRGSKNSYIVADLIQKCAHIELDGLFLPLRVYSLPFCTLLCAWEAGFGGWP